ncbi:kinetochore-associated protein DSN1 homolog isoform X1 [Carcharodon carcharias]|uniref:kinetochore-associated protein DSN1 homolog isoform X1 n=1 Tax=Carcharodon carcharias TaxID=13397 RepID=UPI001B7E423F|nr:kinetochore-associated protein DSN1 homolog isoform X1 [Carcharodon carcharias]
MADGDSIKKRLRSSCQNTPLPDQSSSSKGKCAKHQKPGNPERAAKQDEAPQRSSLPTRRSARLNPGQCVSANLTSEECDSVNPASQTKVAPASPTREPEASEAPSPNKRLKKSPQSRSVLWRRSSFKGGKGRKSLPPIHRDATEICEGIQMDLPEDERLALLFHACLEYTLQKLQGSLEPLKGFSLDAFQAHASDISGDVKRIVETMKLDGTLRKCTEKPDDVLPTPETEMMMKQLKDDISRLNVECKAWDQLLEVYRQKAEDAAAGLDNATLAGGALEPVAMMESSQIDLIRTKPDYRCYLNKDVSVLQNMECIMDQLQLTLNLIARARQEWDSRLQNISEELASRTFKGLEQRPVQKFLMAVKE